MPGQPSDWVREAVDSNYKIWLPFRTCVRQGKSARETVPAVSLSQVYRYLGVDILPWCTKANVEWFFGGFSYLAWYIKFLLSIA